MGDVILHLGTLLLLVSPVLPHAELNSFFRSAIETIPSHKPIPLPIRSSVESIPPRNLRDEGNSRIPLRDAVEKRPIDIPDTKSHIRLKKDDGETEEVEGNLKHYYGAASHLNANYNLHKNSERLQLGNANLHAMQQTSSIENNKKMVICYLQSWAAYRSPPLAFTASFLPRTCTHLHYAFAALHPHTYAIIPKNEDYDVIKGGYRIAVGLKQRQPHLKVIISVGGDGSGRLFSEMLERPITRRAFVNSAVDFLREHGFDGMEFNWANSGDKGDIEKEQLTSLLYELRENFSRNGFILACVLPPFRYQIEDGYDINAINSVIDYATLQAWDMFHGDFEEIPTKTLHHSALHKDPGAANRDRKYNNIEYVVNFLLHQGMASSKLVLGVPLYGRSYTLADKSDSKPGAPVVGWGDEGTFTQTKGMLAFFEICMMEVENKGTSEIDEYGNSYAVFDQQWVSYDSTSTVVEKMKFVLSKGLAGAAAWAVDMDDFRGLCGKPFPIINAISTSLNNQGAETTQSSLKMGDCDTENVYLASDEISCAHFYFCNGGVNYKIRCEDNRLYDASTGFCGHQDASKCIPGQSLRISVEDALRYLTHAYEIDFEWKNQPLDIAEVNPERIVESSVIKKNKDDNQKKVICYMTSWAFYRRGEGKFVPEHIDTRLCTHVVYAYATLTPDELVAKEFDPWADITNNLYERVTSLKDVKVLLATGGWTDSVGDKYSRLVSSSTARAQFIKKLIPFLQMHNFKGLHVDWNYPVCWQSNCKKGARSDKANYAIFIQELSTALHEANMELGLALSGYKEVIESAYDLPALSKAADFMSTMTYDYHGGWETKVGHHTPLQPAPHDSLPYYSIEYAIKTLISRGADPKKLTLGLAFYGQTFRLADAEAKGTPGDAAAGPGEPGEFTKQPGMLSYYEICYRVKNLRWKTGRQKNAGPYAYMDNQWVGYDDPKSITEKVEWALSQGLTGVTAWAIDLDDFNNRCCNEPSPLLRAAGRALGRNVPSPPSSACERPPQPVTPAPPATTTVAADGSVGGNADHGNHDHGSHDHGSHAEHTTTTWPNWNPGAPSTTTQRTQQTWWPQSTVATTTTRSTTTTTTTTTPRPLTSTAHTWWPQSTTTSERPTKRPTSEKPNTQGLEGSPCTAGEYTSSEGECDAYLRCESGQWRKQRCAPGLHWFASAKRCDWPAFAKCKVTPASESSTSSSTLAPTTARPPPPSPTTITQRPTTTTNTTKRPTTQGSYWPAAGPSEGASCSNSQEYYHAVANDCNAYLHCDGVTWKLQRCAAGLHWSAADNHCDWPKYANCKPSSSATTTTKPKQTPRPIQPSWTTAPAISNEVENQPCGYNVSPTTANTCDTYLLCVGGTWKKQPCPPGLHWDNRHKRCDWPEFVMCEEKATTTKRPSWLATTTLRPTPNIIDGSCTTGTYYPHPQCNKFYVCVNGGLISQSCAPGLLWNTARAQCDFPSSSSCTDKRVTTGSDATMMALTSTKCNSGSYDVYKGDCSKYRHCLFGKFEVFSCSPGLYWNQDKLICDWPANTKCDNNITPVTRPLTQATTKPPKWPTNNQIPDIASERPTLDAKPEILDDSYKVVCYYTNWAWYRPGLGQYGPEDIDLTLCTHIVYGFAVLGDDGLITAQNPFTDYENGFLDRVVAFKRYGIKVSLALGGWNDSAGDKYSKLVNDPSARARFARHVIEYLEMFGFNGLDLDWEYPKCWQADCSKGPDSDKAGFAALIRELSAVLKPRGLLLSSAVSPNIKVIDAGYDVKVLSKYLDWIGVMSYDFHGSWDGKTGHVAPLYYHPEDDTMYLNVNYTMHYWMSKGAPSRKLIMGIPLYGQSFTLQNEWDPLTCVPGLNTPCLSGGEAGEYTRANGFLAYYEICENIQRGGWVVVKDPLRKMGPYAFKDNQWVSYDDEEIIKEKVKFIKSLNLGGGMVWALDLDDFKNRCGQGKYPLLNTIKNSLMRQEEEEKEITTVISPVAQFPQIEIEEGDLDDIEVKPVYSPPNKHTTQILNPSATTNTPIVEREEEFKVVCYYTNWAWYRPGSGKFTPNDIDPELCTHVIYAFAVLDSSVLMIKPHDVWLDVENKFYEKVTSMKSRGIKVLLGLGGWNDSAGDKYSRLVNNPSARRAFVIHAMEFLELYKFDGLDLDWEYPKCWQVECEKGPNSDKQGFASLVKELRQAFTPRGLLLSAAVSASKRVIDAGYDVPTLSKNLDWIAVMAYDYHGQWDKKTGHVAPMYARHQDDDKTFNVNFTINYWINKGAQRKKLVLGVPLYGQSFALNSGSNNGVGAGAYAGGEPGDETRARGFLAIYEICERIRIKGWKVKRDPDGLIGPYATLRDQWVSFDDDFMVRHKAEYIRAMGLGGGMIWALDLDDFTGNYCGCGKSPLLTNLNHVLRGHKSQPPCPLEEVESPMGTSAIFPSPSPPAPYAPPATTTTETDIYVPIVHPVGGTIASGSLDGKPCSGIKFAADTEDCNKYYLCINGNYVKLTCPSDLYWNKNHCDWPSNSQCKKTQLRLKSEEQPQFQNEDQPIIACYFSNWAYYRKENGTFSPEQVDSSLCTHIIYSWAHLDPVSYELIPGNAEIDIEYDFFGKITDLKLTGAKIILGVGGLKESENVKWKKLVRNAGHRKIFVKSAVEFLNRWKFDGIQIAWQYPVCMNEPCLKPAVHEKAYFSALLQDLYRAMKPMDFELSAVVSASPLIASLVYDNHVLMTSLDWISVAGNDYYAHATDRTSYITALHHTGQSDFENYKTLVSYWTNEVPARQLVVGIPSYARTYTLKYPEVTGPGAPVTGPGRPGDITTIPGFLAYYEVCSTELRKHWREIRTKEGTYAISESQWASYLTPERVQSIARNLQDIGVRGAALWSLDLDDWRGQCGCQPNPILRAIKLGLTDPTNLITC